MYYPKNEASALSADLFRSPTAEYRGAPFWAWNDELEKEELCRQIDEFHEMGFGGFVMHPRSGLATPYLGEDFMDCVRACSEKAGQNGMLAWLYDEDRYPSGSAGGIVTTEKRFRMRQLLFTTDPAMAELPRKDPGDGEDFLIAAFDITLNPDGTLQSYPILQPGQAAQGILWYAVCQTSRPSGWHNGQAYADLMNPEAIKKFLEVTHGAYYKTLGEAFSGTVPAIFTDEPRVYRTHPKPLSHSLDDFCLPWTADFPETFRAAYGFDLVPHLPELVWQKQDDAPSRPRYLYYDHRAERVNQAYLAQASRWCREHNIALGGHMPGENTLDSQIESTGDLMRAYGYFDIPGMDLLMDLRLPNIAKQCQSTVHQNGKEAMLSELYGVTGWEFDFRQHKLQGDWQAALGVTIRTPHLSWYSMRGSGKRDYPASIHYQSAWYKEYGMLENHYARVNTAMTRGRPLVDIAVIHPIESNWLEFGTADRTGQLRAQLQQDFENVYRWLLHATLDFDYICESTLPHLWQETDNTTLQVGQMAYKTVIVAGCETLRRSTVDILADFCRRGGEVIFLGQPPKYMDAAVPEENSPLSALIQTGKRIFFSKSALLDALEPRRLVDIQLDSGLRGEDWFCGLRQDGDHRWLFLATAVPTPGPGKKGTHPELDGKTITLTLRGNWKPTCYDTLTGEIFPIPYRITPRGTRIRAHLYCHDSLLLRLEPAAKTDTGSDAGRSLLRPEAAPAQVIEWIRGAAVRRTEDNVLLLDLAEWSEDGKTFFPTDEIRRIDKKLRKKYGYPNASGRDTQPWVLGKHTADRFVYLRFAVQTEVDISPRLAYEAVDCLWLDGVPLSPKPTGWFTDRHIVTACLPPMEKGTHTLVVKVPFGARESLENLFLLGDFDLKLQGIDAVITAPTAHRAFRDLAHQGMPFYGGCVEYTLPFETEQDARLVLRTLRYKGAVLTVSLDGQPMGRIAFSPYRLDLGEVPAGAHTLTITACLTRHNCFASLHNTSGDIYTGGGVYWYPKGDSFCYEYLLIETGLLQSPRLEIYPL